MDFHPRRYADRAIQTTHICAGLSCIQVPEVGYTSQTSVGSDDSSNTHEIGDQLPLAEKQLGSADACFSRTGSKGYVGTAGSPRSGYKHTGIGSGHPSHRICENKRLLSLPGAIVTIERSVSRNDHQARVVSMPERNQRGKFVHTEASYVQLSDPTDVSYYSMASDQAPAFQTPETERLYPVDLPQTPSPPSSPDSVMIIGNENKVAGSFLRRLSTDADGWTSWATSPPRPIPALHGPLSLPYARCPSGAEGTIVDGDDLSNKVWGLSIQDDSQGSNSRSARLTVNQAQHQQGGVFTPTALSHTQRRENPGTQISLQRGSQVTIDLSKPSALRNFGDTPSGLRTPQRMNHVATLGYSVTGDVQKVATIVRPDDLNYSTPLDRSNPQRSKQADSHALCGKESFGLGVNWNGSSHGSVHASTFNNDTRNVPNTGFLATVPTHGNGIYTNHSTVYGYPGRERNRVSMSTERETTARARTSTIYSLQPDCNLSTVATAASTAASLHCQYSEFPRSFDVAKQRAILPRHVQHYSARYSPRIYSPQMESHANKLRVMMEQLQCEDHSDYTTHTGFLAQKNVTLTHPHYSSAFEQYDTPPGQNELAFFPSIINSHEAMMPATELGHLEPGELDETDIAFSSERRRNLSHQHPRSIPLARLIQRRLSAVAEDDGSLSPMLHQRMSRMAIKQPRTEENTSVYVNNIGNGKFDGLQDTVIESAVSVENTPYCAGSSTAVVNLPRNTVLPHRKLARNNITIIKENVGQVPAFTMERFNQGKPHHRQKRINTPFRLATNSISSTQT